MEEYKISQLTDRGRIPELKTLFATGLDATEDVFWKWKYWDENGLPERYMLMIENGDGKMVGMFGFQFLEYFCGEKRLCIVQTQDLVIDPAHRGSGLMRKLYFYAMDFCRERGGDAFVAYPNDNSRPVFLKYGARDMRGVGSLATKKNLLRNFIAKPVMQKQRGDWLFRVQETAPEDIFFSESHKQYKLNKSLAYMKWKFDRNPEDRFLWLTARENGKLRGWFVFSVCRGRLNRAVNLYDYEWESGAPEEVFRQSVSMLKPFGAWVSVWGRPEEREARLFAAAGFQKRSSVKTSFTLHSLRGDAMPENWRLTRADLDY